MSGGLSDLVGAPSGSHLEQSGDPTEEFGVSDVSFQPAVPVASDLDFFGGDGVLGASPQISLGDGHIQPGPAEDHDKRLKPDIPLAKSEYNRLLFEARMGAVGDAEVRMPWEQGVWKQIFSGDDDDTSPQVVPPVPGEYLCPPTAQAAGHAEEASSAMGLHLRDLLSTESALPFYSYAVKVHPDRDAIEEMDKLWRQAIYKWQQVFEILGYPGALGVALLQEQLESSPDECSTVLRDSLGIKSPRTAYKRAQTLLQYFSWLQQHMTDWNPWDRHQCLQYLAADSHARSSASRGMTLLEAFRFSRFVLGIPIQDALLSDPQLRGRAQRLMSEKETYKPARPLRVSELACLEKLMETLENPIDVYMLGAVIFAVLSRSRWSDLKLIHQIWIEKVSFNCELYGFVEARTKHHKTATTLAKKQRYMPLVAPVLGVTTTDWTKPWTEAMVSLGVQMESEPFGALCRAPTHDGNLCRRSCTTEEIGTFLNKVLKTSGETQVTSHSLKHTTLVWCAAYGMDEPARTLLGHHELQGAKAMTVYSRDLLTRPLQLYCSMLANIRLDHFRPDETRTNRMVDLLKLSSKEQPGMEKSAQPGTGQVEPTAETVDDEPEPTSPMGTDTAQSASNLQGQDESSDIASTSSSSSDSSDDDEEVPSAAWIPGPVWRNIRSHVVHKCSAINRQTVCGRLADDEHFELLCEGCSTINARCSRCFRGEVVSSVDGLVEALDQSKAKRQRAK